MLVIFAVLFVGIALAHGYFYACLLQSKSYRAGETLMGAGLSLRMDALAFLGAVACSVIYSLCFTQDYVYLWCVLGLLPSLFCVVYKAIRFKRGKLSLTHRLISIALIYAGTVVILAGVFAAYLATLLGAVLGFCLPLLLFANAVARPFFLRKNKKYLRACKEKLESVRPLVVGITGSAGKTTVKNILKEFLVELGETYATPMSYNTPLGIARSVEEMPLSTRVFIAEMGARRTGDIAELIALTRPTVGVLTAIAPQHLQTFGSLEALVREKSLLLASCEKSFAAASTSEYVGYFAPHTRLADSSCVRNVIFSVTGTSFELLSNNVWVPLRFSLLGAAQFEDLLLAITVARALGISEEHLLRVIPGLTPTPHRLCGSVTPQGVYLLDDGYNVNPLGAKAALSLLSTYEGRKIVTTSGFVELGKTESAENKSWASALAEKADIVIVLGNKNKKTLLAELQGKVECYYAEDVENVKKLYARLLRAGDALLITANLPDEYCM